jgi:uncharacterized membrane protein HdeD (DUF308 family)
MAEVWRRSQGWATAVVGVLLFLTPFLFGATGAGAAAWAAYVAGVLLVIAGVWSYATPSVRWTEWAEVAIGVLVFRAPWALGFSALTSMATSAWIAGIFAVVLGGSVLLGERGPAQMAKQH